MGVARNVNAKTCIFAHAPIARIAASVAVRIRRPATDVEQGMNLYANLAFALDVASGVPCTWLVARIVTVRTWTRVRKGFAKIVVSAALCMPHPVIVAALGAKFCAARDIAQDAVS